MSKEIEAEVRKWFQDHPEVFEVEQREIGTESELEYHVRIVAAFVSARIVDELPLCPPHKRLEEIGALKLETGDCLACSLNADLYKWHKTSDGLPETDGEYLWRLARNGYVVLREMSQSNHRQVPDYYQTAYTHWAKIPSFN